MNQLQFVIPWIVAIASIVICIGLPLCVWILFRFFAHRERMEMIRHGMVPSEHRYGIGIGPRSGRKSLMSTLAVRRGISLFFIGLILLVAISFVGYASGHAMLGPWLLGGIIPMLAGLAEIAGGLLGGKSFDDSTETQWLRSPRSSGAGLESERQEDRR